MERASHSEAVMNASWMALLTTLTLGAGAGVVRAQLRAVNLQPAKRMRSPTATAGRAPRRGESRGEGMRLVVQTYDAEEGRALGAIQRVVTPAELARGLSVDIPHMPSAEEPYVVAWVERGAPDLEHDGLDARPKRGSLVGFAHGDDVSIDLSCRC
jgi:hypothetical protein